MAFLPKYIANIAAVSNVWFGTTPPVDMDKYPMWWDTTTGTLKVYFQDGTSNQWVDANSNIGPQGIQGATGSQGPTSNTEIAFTISGTLSVQAGSARWYLAENKTISNVIATVSIAPTGASLIFDVNKNGSTIFTTQGNRPTIAAGAYTDLSSVPAITSLTTGDYLTVDVDQVGSSVAGADAVVRIVLG